MHFDEILLDYGIIVKNVYANVRLFSELKDIAKMNYNTKTVVEALAVLIEKRFIEYKVVNNATFYVPNYLNLQRRMYFALYIDFVTTKHGKELAEIFEKVLIRGICNKNKITDRLLLLKLIDYKLVIEYEQKLDSAEIVKKQKKEVENDFVMVNYNELEQKMMLQFYLAFLDTFYDKSIRHIFEMSMSCLHVNKKTLNDLLTKKGSQTEKLGIQNTYDVKQEMLDKNNTIENCISLFKNDSVYVEDFKVENYRIDFNNVYKILKRKRIAKFIDKKLNCKYKRIYNLILEKKYVEDKDVVKFGLIDMKETRKMLFVLYEEGYIRISNITKENKQVMVWEADDTRSCCNVSSHLLDEIFDKLRMVNRYNNRALNKQSDDVYVHVSDMLNSVKELFVVNYGQRSNNGPKLN